jgi:Spy/CpxP family protein refolding chaperone
MRKVSFKTAALGTLATVLVATGAYAADPAAVAQTQTPTQQQPTPPPHQRGEWLQKKLGLSDAQMQQIREIRQKDFAAQKQNYQALRQAQSDLRRLALSNADPGAISAKQTEVNQLLAQSTEARVNFLKEVGPVLTPDQRDAFAKMMDHGPRRHRQAKRPAPAQQQPSS